MKVAISQPRYLPAVIYLQRIKLVDLFVLLDDVQHSREFENRNYIKISQGKKWLTISCKGKRTRKKINELEISNPNWIDEHKKTIKYSYGRAPYYDDELLDFIYKGIDPENLSLVSVLRLHISNCMELLDINTPVILSSDLRISSTGVDKLVDICKAVGATTYISGINGKNYIRDEFFKTGIRVLYHIYDHPVYTQLWGDFIPWMGFIDPLFNVGREEVVGMLDRNFRLLEE